MQPYSSPETPSGPSFWQEFRLNWLSLRAASRSQKSSEPRIGEPRPSWPIWTLQRIFLVFLAFLPWLNGAISWTSQLGLSLFLLAAWIVVLALVKIRKGSSTSWAAPRLALWILLLAGIACLQSVRWFSVESQAWAPPAVQIQRWSLGRDVRLQSSGFTNAMNEAIENSTGLDGSPSELDRSELASSTAKSLIAVRDQSRLAVSLSPDLTRSALISLVMAALSLWLGGMLFRGEKALRELLVTMTVVGMMVAAVHFIQSVAWKIPFWAYSEYSKPVGPFLHKNIGGAYLCLAFAAASGLALYSFAPILQSRSRSKRRYDLATNPWGRAIKSMIDRFGKLTTSHLVIGIVVSGLMAAIIASLSRGALLSALLGVVLVGGLIVRQVKVRFLFMAISVVLFIATITVIGLDRQSLVLGRLESAEQDLESGRFPIWQAALKAATYYLGTGSGLGTFRFAAIPFYESRTTFWLGYAESSLGHLLVEFGWLGLVAVLALLIEGVGLLRKVSLLASQDLKRSGLIAGPALAFATLFFHNIFDFVIVSPAIFISAAFLFGAAIAYPAKSERTQRKKLTAADRSDMRESGRSSRTARGNRRKATWMSKVASIAAFALVVVCSTMGIPELYRSALEENQLRRFKALDSEPSETMGESMERSWFERFAWVTPSMQRRAEWHRILGGQDLLAWRENYAEQQADAGKEIAWQETQPSLVRIGIERSLKKGGDAISSLGGIGNVALWNDGRVHYSLAHRLSPLDWRSMTSQTTLDWTIERAAARSWLYRCSALSEQMPQALFRIGWLAEEMGFRDLADHCFERVMKRKNFAMPIGKILATYRVDGEIDDRIFPTDISELERLATLQFRASNFPQLHRQLWTSIQGLAEEMQTSDYRRWQWMAKAALENADWSAGERHLREVVRLNPTSVPDWIALIQFHLMRKQIEEAKATLDQAIRLNGTLPELVRSRSEIEKYLRLHLEESNSTP